MKYSRIFLLVLDSLGIGAMDDAAAYGDAGANTLRTGRNGSPSPACCVWEFPTLPGGGASHPGKAYRFRHADERKSVGKDTMTGHWELMGSLPPSLFSPLPKPVFRLNSLGNWSFAPDAGLWATGLPAAPVFWRSWGSIRPRRVISSSTTSGDSELQICGNEETIGLSSSTAAVKSPGS